MTLSPTALLAQSTAVWSFKDGSGSTKVNDSGKDKLDAKIVDPQKASWTREDDRGFFINFAGGTVSVDDNPGLAYKDGFILDIRFACNLEAIGGTNFASLFTKGNTFQDGYSVMIGKDGSLLFNPRGLVPTYKLIPLNLKSNTDYHLKIAAGGGFIQIYLNNILVNQYAVKGQLSDAGHPLSIGSIAKYPFTGNIYYAKIAPYSPNSVPVKPESDEGREVQGVPKSAASAPSTKKNVAKKVIVDPAGTVLVTDFSKFTPESLTGGFGSDRVRWRIRADAAFMSQTHSVLHPPMDLNAPELTFDPKLKGKYDLYLGGRAIGSPTTVQFRLNEKTQDYYTVTLGTTSVHTNVEVLLGRDIEMEGQSLRIGSCGNFYMGFVKLIPVANRRNPETATSPLGHVEIRSRITREELDAVADKDIQAKINSGYFIERTYVEKVPAAAPSTASSKRGYQLFERNWMDLLFHVTVPQTDTGTLAIKVAAAPGEFEPVTFGIRGLRDIKGVTLKLSEPFKSADGKQANVQANIAIVGQAVKRTTNFTQKSEFIRGPQYLEPAYPLDIQNEQTHQYWITVKPSEDTPAGKYKAQFQLTAGGNIQNIPVELEVYPFKLTPAKGYDIGFWAYFSSKDEAATSMKHMADHGMTSVIAYADEVLQIKGKTLETLTIDFDQSILPVIASAYNQYNMPGYLHLISKELMDNILVLPEAQQELGYRKLVDQLQEYSKANQWPPMTYLSYDEILSEVHHLPMFIKEVNMQKSLGLKTINNHIWYKTSRPYQNEVDQTSGAIDIFMNRFNTRKLWYVDSWEEMEKESARLGKQIYAYNSNNAIVFAQPSAMRYMAGWFFRTAGKATTGQMIWVYNAPRENPYNDLDGSTADWCYYYPPYGTKKGGPSIDYESFREGVDDLRYILTLEETIAKANKRQINTTAAQQLLDSIKASFDMDRFHKNSVFFDSKWTNTWEDASGKRFASGQYNLPNGWALDQYDQARHRVADAIIQLQSHLSKD